MLVAKNLYYETANGPLFENIEVALDSANPKRVAIVGRNGCGKSTLLKLLKGDLTPTAGTVNCSREVVAHLSQDIQFSDETQLVGTYLESKLEEEWMTYKLEMVLEEVGLSQDITLLELSHLSGGQRVRIALAELLLVDPTILLLDEPTNHLDVETIEWLVAFVKNFRGTVAFVSHDRYFINAVVDKIWEITPERTIEVYGCNYDQFLVERYDRYQKKLAAHELSQREVNELESWLRENANHPKYKFTSIVAQRKKALERLEKRAPPEPVADPRVRMRDLARSTKGNVLTVRLEKKNYEERELLKALHFKVESGDRIRVKGPNGSGKTTLLNILSGEDQDYKGEVILRDGTKIGYLRQFSMLNPENTVLDEFGEKTSLEYTKGRGALAGYLFPAELVDEKVKNLSYGQQRRLELAILLTNQPDLLLLDEPTNHLDLFLREDLERFLLEQNLAMCIISHDTYFVEKIGITRVIELK
jgi:ATPase subunit of ABC transporter with duplicated ATPase domains